MGPKMATTITLKELSKLLEEYYFEPYETHGNEIAAFTTGLPNGNSAHIGVFDGIWFIVSISFGEVRHVWSNRTHIGEHGLASASSSFKFEHDPNDPVGSNLKGNELLGFKWRPSLVVAKNRKCCGIDEYVQVPDIIKYLTSLKEPLVSDDMWEVAEEGW